MGLLDDAIREHLQLKRSHGADPSEVARQEAEALGPVKRGEVDLADRPAAAAEDAPAPVPEPERAPAHEGPQEDEHDKTPPHGDPLVHDEPGTRHGHDAEAEAAAAQHTREFTAADLAEAQGGAVRMPDPDVVAGEEDEAAGEHDELEDTPEFLQETPEHDRLWFEQKPPKDFDF